MFAIKVSTSGSSSDVCSACIAHSAKRAFCFAAASGPLPAATNAFQLIAGGASFSGEGKIIRALCNAAVRELRATFAGQCDYFFGEIVGQINGQCYSWHRQNLHIYFIAPLFSLGKQGGDFVAGCRDDADFANDGPTGGVPDSDRFKDACAGRERERRSCDG